MAKVKIAVVVGSNRRESINAKLGHALARLGSEQAEFNFVSIGELPLYNQDLEGELPRSVVGFKAEIAAADGLLSVTPEHNRSIPAVLKNAIDWGARPYGRNSWNGKPAAITERRQAHSARRWRKCICGRFWELWAPSSSAEKPTSRSSPAWWMRTGPSPMRTREDFSRHSSISSRRSSSGCPWRMRPRLSVVDEQNEPGPRG